MAILGYRPPMAAAHRLSEEDLRILHNIELRMGELQLTGLTVAGQAGIAPTTWYRRWHNPGKFTLDELGGVADVLRCTVADLVS